MVRLSARTVLKHSAAVAFRKIVDEVLLVPIRKTPQEKLGIYTLNRTGAFLWELIDGVRTFADLVGALTERFEVSRTKAHADAKAFFTDLLSCGALLPADPHATESGPGVS